MLFQKIALFINLNKFFSKSFLLFFLNSVFKSIYSFKNGFSSKVNILLLLSFYFFSLFFLLISTYLSLILNSNSISIFSILLYFAFFYFYFNITKISLIIANYILLKSCMYVHYVCAMCISMFY